MMNDLAPDSLDVTSSLETETAYRLMTDSPGLGIEVDEVAAKYHPFQQEVIDPMTVRCPLRLRGSGW